MTAKSRKLSLMDVPLNTLSIFSLKTSLPLNPTLERDESTILFTVFPLNGEGRGGGIVSSPVAWPLVTYTLKDRMVNPLSLVLPNPDGYMGREVWSLTTISLSPVENLRLVLDFRQRSDRIHQFKATNK
jgi:hypothetical protein